MRSIFCIFVLATVVRAVDTTVEEKQDMSIMPFPAPVLEQNQLNSSAIPALALEQNQLNSTGSTEEQAQPEPVLQQNQLNSTASTEEQARRDPYEEAKREFEDLKRQRGYKQPYEEPKKRYEEPVEYPRKEPEYEVKKPYEGEHEEYKEPEYKPKEPVYEKEPEYKPKEPVYEKEPEEYKPKEPEYKHGEPEYREKEPYKKPWWWIFQQEAQAQEGSGRNYIRRPRPPRYPNLKCPKLGRCKTLRGLSETVFERVGNAQTVCLYSETSSCNLDLAGSFCFLEGRYFSPNLVKCDAYGFCEVIDC